VSFFVAHLLVSPFLSSSFASLGLFHTEMPFTYRQVSPPLLMLLPLLPPLPVAATVGRRSDKVVPSSLPLPFLFCCWRFATRTLPFFFFIAPVPRFDTFFFFSVFSPRAVVIFCGRCPGRLFILLHFSLIFHLSLSWGLYKPSPWMALFLLRLHCFFGGSHFFPPPLIGGVTLFIFLNNYSLRRASLASCW